MTPITGPIVSKRLCQQNNEKTTTNIFSPQSPSPEKIEDCSQITETQLVPEQTNNFSLKNTVRCWVRWQVKQQKQFQNQFGQIPQILWNWSIMFWKKQIPRECCWKYSKTILWSPACCHECRTWTADGFISSVEWDTGICVSINTLKTPQIKRWAGKPLLLPCVVCRVFLGNNISQLCFFFCGDRWVTEQDIEVWINSGFFFFFLESGQKRKRGWGCCCWGQTSEQRKSKWVAKEKKTGEMKRNFVCASWNPLFFLFLIGFFLFFFSAGISSIEFDDNRQIFFFLGQKISKSNSNRLNYKQNTKSQPSFAVRMCLFFLWIPFLHILFCELFFVFLGKQWVRMWTFCMLNRQVHLCHLPRRFSGSSRNSLGPCILSGLHDPAIEKLQPLSCM